MTTPITNLILGQDGRIHASPYVQRKLSGVIMEPPPCGAVPRRPISRAEVERLHPDRRCSECPLPVVPISVNFVF